ncbi:hypothetical protein [Brevibacillus sp. H7]|uniref:hypothetical protein n=1 Tax=Brevibacillus sp. H7 TaxID=3349138 RepID=UPI00381DC075
MKKWIMLLIAFVLVLAPNGMGYDQADAKKSYKSGPKPFDSNTTPNKTDSHVNSSTPNNTTSPVKNTSAAAPGKGGFIKGLLFGGLAGLLFGSLFSDLGILGAIFGFFLNVLAVWAVVILMRKAYTYFKNQRKKQEWNAWKP